MQCSVTRYTNSICADVLYSSARGTRIAIARQPTLLETTHTHAPHPHARQKAVEQMYVNMTFCGISWMVYRWPALFSVCSFTARLYSYVTYTCTTWHHPVYMYSHAHTHACTCICLLLLHTHLMCIHTHTHTHLHTYTHTYIHTLTFTGCGCSPTIGSVPSVISPAIGHAPHCSPIGRQVRPQRGHQPSDQARL